MRVWLPLLIWVVQAVGTSLSQPTLNDARQQFFARRFEEATATLKEVISSQPADVAARYLLVRTLIENNQALEALREAELAGKECPANPLSHVAVGDARFRLADFDQAQIAYQEAVRLDPKEPRAHLGMGRALLSDFRFRSAREHLQTAFSLNSEDPDVALALSSVTAPSAQKIKLEEQYADQATYRDPEELEGTRALASLFKLRAGRRPFAVSDPPEAASVSLQGVPAQSLRPVAFVVEVALNGCEPAKLLFDTGAHGLVISSRLAQIGAIRRLVPYRLGGLGDSGRAAASLGWVDSINIGGRLVVRDCPVIITDSDVGQMWEGIIGSDVLRDFLISLDFPNNVLRIERLGRPGEEEYSWDRSTESSSGFAPARLVEGKLLVKTNVNTAGAGFFVLDTGASQTLIDRRFGEAWSKLRSSRRRIGGISGEVREVLRSEELLLQWAGLEHRRSLTAVDLSRLSYALGVEIGGLLGCDLLRDVCLTIDYRNGLIRAQAGLQAR